MSEVVEISQWISEVLERPIPAESLEETLKSGVILCELINKITQTGNNSLNMEIKQPSKSSLGFFQMENIAYFIEKARAFGVPDNENFQTIDLYEGKNMKQVYTCIYSLSRNLFMNGRADIKVIGPKLTKKTAITFTQEQLDEAKRTVSKQYGTIRKNID